MLAAFVLGGIAPDLDLLIIWVNYIHPTTLLLVHRGITHTLFFGLFTALVVLYLACSRTAKAATGRFIELDLDFSLPALALAYAGVLSHLFLDYLTTRGVPLFYPWSATRFSANIFFHTEIVMLIVSLVIMACLFRDRGRDISRAKLLVAFIAIFLVVGAIRIDGKENSEGVLEDYTARSYPDAGLFKWNILDEDEDRFLVDEYNSLSRTSQYSATYPRINATSGVDPERAIRAGDDLPQVKLFRWRAHAVAVNASLQNETWNLEYYDPVGKTEIMGSWPILRMMLKSYSSVEVEVNGETATVL